jgi:pyrroline-5-carboxylate reductase
MKKAIGIIGFGNMGKAIAERIKSKYQVFIFDKDKEKTQDVPGVKIAENSADLVNSTDCLLLAVKPQDFDSVLGEIKSVIKDKLVISIAAGITTGYIEKFLGKARVIRVMPNIAAKIGEAESSLCKGKSAKGADLDLAKELFDCVGKTWVMDEGMLNAATAISGSGPAYIFYDMEIKKIDPANVSEEIKQKYTDLLKKAAERVGFDSQTALDLAVHTSASSLHLVTITGKSPAELKQQVTSKGGTTEAALKKLASGGTWEEAAEAAKKRAEELSKS